MDHPTFDLPDPGLLESIENHFWSPVGSAPESATAVVRGAPITGEKFLAHSVRQAREYSLRALNMASVSVDLVMVDWPVERILAAQLSTYSRFATCAVEELTAAGFEVVATGRPPHADVVLPTLSILEGDRLASLFAPTEARNPFKGRR
jgi:hypothetical protein